MMAREEHWNRIYESKPSDSVSWFQSVPATSLRLLDEAGLGINSCVADVGGGDSRLVDALLDRGLGCVTVLDISEQAISRAQTRLGPRASGVQWIVSDVTRDWPGGLQDFWHDRAVFHFLVEEWERRRYLDNLQKALKPGGHAVIATFATDGPTRCSGMPVIRYSADSLHDTLGAGFALTQSFVEPHATPMGTTQSFLFAVFRRTA